MVLCGGGGLSTTSAQARNQNAKTTGPKEIVLPISLAEYQQHLSSPKEFRRLLEQQYEVEHQYEANPNCFPMEFEDGFQLRDIIQSKKMGGCPWHCDGRIDPKDLTNPRMSEGQDQPFKFRITLLV